jgi:ribosomal protein S24E
MSAKSRKEVLEQARQRYGKRGREGRSRLLDEVCELCGYERKYAIKVLGRQTSDNRQQRAQARRFAGYLPGRGTRVIRAIWLAAD